MRLYIPCLPINSFIEGVGIKALDNFILPTQGIDEVVVSNSVGEKIGQSEILERYIDTKGYSKAELLFVHAKRNIGYVISALDNKSIDVYSKTDAVEFRNWLIKRELQSSSVQRILMVTACSAKASIF